MVLRWEGVCVLLRGDCLYRGKYETKGCSGKGDVLEGIVADTDGSEEEIGRRTGNGGGRLAFSARYTVETIDLVREGIEGTTA